MKISTRQIFALRSNGKQVIVTKVNRSGFENYAHDLCRVSDLVAGKSIRGTGRILLADSLRRRYTKVSK